METGLYAFLVTHLGESVSKDIGSYLPNHRRRLHRKKTQTGGIEEKNHPDDIVRVLMARFV